MSSAIVAVLLITAVGGTMIYSAIQQGREASRRTTVRCRLKQFGLAAYNFHDRHNHFPPRNLPTITKLSRIPIDPNAVPHSFFTNLLEFMGQEELYRRVNFQLPWTNPENQPAFSTIVSSYQNPSLPDPPRNADGFALGHYATNSKCICDTKTVVLEEITDGTSNTMLLGTVNASLQAWGDPTNYRDPSKGFGGGPEAFGAAGQDKFIQILLFDGSARTVSIHTPADICTKLGDPRDGQPQPDLP